MTANDCICGGVNHGVGLKRATDNTRLMADAMIEDYAEKKGIDPKSIKVNLGVNKLNIFE